MSHSLKPVWRPWTRLATTLASSSKRTGQGYSHSHLHGQREDRVQTRWSLHCLLVRGVCGGFCGFLIFIYLRLTHRLPEVTLTDFQKQHKSILKKRE